MLSFRPDSAATTYSLPAQLDLRAAKPLKEALAACLAKGQDMVLDAGNVARISTAAAQIIVAFILASRDATLKVTIAPASGAFTQAFELLGLKPVLEDHKQ